MVEKVKKAGAVVSLPTSSHIPRPQFQLNEVAMRKYEEVCLHLMQEGLLNAILRDKAEVYAILHSNINDIVAAGKPLKAALAREHRSLTWALAPENIKQGTSVAATTDTNKFSKFGFAGRRPNP